MSPQDGATGFLSFHRDELAAQMLAGQQAPRAAIRPFMPDQHRAFFALLPYLFTATLDERGWPMASVLTGDRGFAQSPDPPRCASPPFPGPAIRRHRASQPAPGSA